jgi:hypothetical protein
VLVVLATLHAMPSPPLIATRLDLGQAGSDVGMLIPTLSKELVYHQHVLGRRGRGPKGGLRVRLFSKQRCGGDGSLLGCVDGKE